MFRNSYRKVGEIGRLAGLREGTKGFSPNGPVKVLIECRSFSILLVAAVHCCILPCNFIYAVWSNANFWQRHYSSTVLRQC